MKTILRIGAWLSLIGGIAAGIGMFRLGGPGIAFGIAYILSGFLIWALLLVVAGIKDQLERVEYSASQLLQKAERTESKKQVKSYSVLDRI